MTNTTFSTQTKAETRIAFFRSLRGKLILLFLAVSLLPLIIVGLLAYLQAQQALEDEVTAKLVAVRDIKANWITSYFNERLGDVRVLSENPSTVIAMHAFDEAIESSMKELDADETGAMNHYRSLYLGKPDQADAGDDSDYSAVHARYHPMFKEYQKEYGYYDIFLVGPHSGNIVYSVFKEDDFGTGLKNGKYAATNISEVFQKTVVATERDFALLEDFADYAPSQEPAAFVASPIFEGAELVGVLIFQLPIDHIDAIMKDEAGMGESGEAYLVGSDKLMRSDSRFSQESTILKREVDTITANKALAGQTGVEVVPDYRDVPVLSAYKPLDISGVHWVILAEIDEAEAFAPAQQMLLVMLAIMGVGAAVVAAVAFFSARSIANPVMRVTEVARKLAIGDVNQVIEINSRDEIGVMAESFQQIIDYLKTMAGAANSLAKGDLRVKVTPRSEQDVLGNAFAQMVVNLRQVIGQLNVVIDQVVQSVEQVRSVGGDLSSNAEEQSAAVEEVTSNLEETDAQVKANAENANVANQLVNETSNVAGSGQVKMKSMTEAMDAIAVSSRQIGKIIKVIDEIAFQTNLLALNAAVEAARAGQHGRGFAVVAQEVRNLAGRSAKAAKETAELIEDAGRRVDGGVVIADETASALGEIVQNVVKVKDLVAEIAAASEEQAKGITQISASMVQTNESAQISSQQSEELSSTADELSSMADRLREEASRFTLKRGQAYADAAENGRMRQKAPQQQYAAKAGDTSGETKPQLFRDGDNEVELSLDQDERGYEQF